MSETQQEVKTTVPASTDPEISINDLQKILQIIDAAAERGAFKGNELSIVGNSRDRLANFLTAVIPKDQPATAPTTN